MVTSTSSYRVCWDRGYHQDFIDHVRKGRYRSVYLSTSPCVTEVYLRQLAAADEELLVIAEKPWWQDYHSALALAGDLDNSSVCFRFFDHYLYRGVVQFLSQKPLPEWLGGPVKSVDISLFESAPWTSDAQGLTGITRDLLIHGVSVCCKLLPDDELVVTGAAAARHIDSRFDTETWATVEAQTGCAASIAISLAAAKFVPAELAGKTMFVDGGDARLEIDLAADTVDLVDSAGRRRLYPIGERLPDAYEVLVEKLALAEETIGFELHEALYVLQLLDDAQRILQTKPMVVLGSDEYPPKVDSYKSFAPTTAAPAG